jgi:diguanylate cyclase (GGDEF)-like protein
MLYQQKIANNHLRSLLLSEHLRHSRFGLPGVQLLAVVAVLGLVWFQVDTKVLIGWAMAMFLLSALQVVQTSRAMRQKAFIDRPVRTETFLTLGAVINGGAWALSVIWLEPQLPDMTFYFLLLLVTVMVVTAMAVISVVRVVYQCWLLSTIVPIACLLSWHFDQRPFNLQMSLSLLGLTIVLLFVGHWVSQSFSELTRSSLEKQAMNEEFSTLSENLKERNFQLQQLRDQLAEMATVDELTGLRNRRGGNQLLEIELDRAKRSHVPLAVVAVDVDCFKQYNDTYGHPSGDRVLQRVAQTLLSTTSRAGEAAIRMGGEEFLLVLPGADGDDAMKTAGLVRQRLEASAIAHGASTVASHLTVSLGVVSCIPEVKTKVDDLLAGADQALYESKSQGRDRATLGRIGV